MSSDWTINTCVLYKAADTDLDASKFLMNILNNQHKVRVDHKHYILNQYKVCVRKTTANKKKGSELLRKWHKEVVGKYIRWCCGDLNSKHKSALRVLKFHEKDWPFVAVCSNSACKNLVSEDSDYTDDVKNYLSNKMKIHVLTIKESLDK